MELAMLYFFGLKHILLGISMQTNKKSVEGFQKTASLRFFLKEKQLGLYNHYEYNNH